MGLVNVECNMPKDYLVVRDSCIEKKKKKNGGKISKKEIQDCKKMASIWFYKKHGKTVKEMDSSLAISDCVVYNIEYYDRFFKLLNLWEIEEWDGS